MAPPLGMPYSAVHRLVSSRGWGGMPRMASEGLVYVCVCLLLWTLRHYLASVIWGMQASPRPDTQDGPCAVTVTGSRNTDASLNKVGGHWYRAVNLEKAKTPRMGWSGVELHRNDPMTGFINKYTSHNRRWQKYVWKIPLHMSTGFPNMNYHLISDVALTSCFHTLHRYCFESNLDGTTVAFRGWRHGVKSSPRSDNWAIVIKLGRPSSRVAAD